jgi:uncharacterized lipoprotein YajG
MGPQNEVPPLHDFSSERSMVRYRQAKRRVVDRLSRLNVTDLRKASRAASMLTWNELIDLFARRARIRAPKKGTLARTLMNYGFRVGCFLDRIIARINRDESRGV